LARSQRRASPGLALDMLLLTEASCLLSGLKATPVTAAVWPRRVRASGDVVMSQILTSPGPLAAPPADARRPPAGENAMARTGWRWPRRLRTSLPVAASQSFTI